MDIRVYSRAKASFYCTEPHSTESVIISISTPGRKYIHYPFTSKDNKVLEILNLEFCDADRAGDHDVYGYITTEADIMNDEDARRIAELVEAHKDARIIVHCDAGISRSAGVGAALARHYNNDDFEYFTGGRYAPNMRCYYKVLKALGDDITPDGAIEIDN